MYSLAISGGEFAGGRSFRLRIFLKMCYKALET